MRILSVSQFLDLVNETLKALSEYEVFGVEGEVAGSVEPGAVGQLRSQGWRVARERVHAGVEA